jgi:hypothetical protein
MSSYPTPPTGGGGHDEEGWYCLITRNDMQIPEKMMIDYEKGKVVVEKRHGQYFSWGTEPAIADSSARPARKS